MKSNGDEEIVESASLSSSFKEEHHDEHHDEEVVISSEEPSSHEEHHEDHHDEQSDEHVEARHEDKQKSINPDDDLLRQEDELSHHEAQIESNKDNLDDSINDSLRVAARLITLSDESRNQPEQFDHTVHEDEPSHDGYYDDRLSHDDAANHHEEKSESIQHDDNKDDLDRSVSDALQAADRLVKLEDESKENVDLLEMSIGSTLSTEDNTSLSASCTDAAVVAAAESLALEQVPPTTKSNKYNLSSEQLELVEDFFNRLKRNNLLSNDILRPLMSEALKIRDDVLIANESDVDRVLEAVDRDQDHKVNNLIYNLEMLLILIVLDNLYFASRYSF